MIAQWPMIVPRSSVSFCSNLQMMLLISAQTSKLQSLTA
jgi:hypothetical protein